MTKKWITGVFALVLCLSASVTTAMAIVDEIDVNKYNQTYSKQGDVNELHYSFSGSTSQATTSASNNTNYYSRYVTSYVAKKKMSDGSVLLSDSDNITTTNAGVFSYVARNSMTDKTVYYFHQAQIKPSATIPYVIGGAKYVVSQIPNS